MSFIAVRRRTRLHPFMVMILIAAKFSERTLVERLPHWISINYFQAGSFSFILRLHLHHSASPRIQVRFPGRRRGGIKHCRRRSIGCSHLSGPWLIALLATLLPHPIDDQRMLITIPATAHGREIADSILDLEPLFDYLHECRPDAVRLTPPLGADDQPNGPALLAMKVRLEAEGIGVVPERLRVPANAPVEDESWRAQWLFETRALLTALGEAGVEPLDVTWLPRAGREVIEPFLEGLLPEAETSGVHIAFQGTMPLPELAAITQSFRSPWLGIGAGADHFRGSRTTLGAAAGRILTFDTLLNGKPEESRDIDWPAVMRLLVKSGFEGPLLIDGLSSPLAYAKAVGYFRGLLAATQRAARVPLITA